MNYQLTSKDVPKIALALILLLAIAGFFMSKSRQGRAEHESRETIVRMNREMGLPFIDTAQPKERQSQEEDNRQEQASALRTSSVAR